MAKCKIYFLLLIFLAGAWLRFYKLGSQSMWQDEAYAVSCSQQSIPGIIEWQIKDSSPPLYYILLKLWSTFNDYGEWWIRSFSVMNGILFLIVLFLIVKKLVNNETALFALGITAISPYMIYYSQETRMYSMLPLLSVLIFYCFISYKKNNSKAALILYTLLSLVLLYTHNYGIFIVGTGFLVSILKRRSGEKELLWTHLIILVFYLPWIFGILTQLSGNNTAWIHTPELKDLARTLVYFAGWSWKLPFKAPDILFIITGLIIIIIAFLFSIFSLYFTNKNNYQDCKSPVDIKILVFFLIIPAFTSFLISYLKPIYVAGRYDVIFYPFFIILVALGLSRMDNTKFKYILFIMLILSNAFLLKSYYHDFNKSNDRDLANYIFENAKSDSLLVFTDLSSTPFEYYCKMNSKSYDLLRFPGGPKGWIEKDAFLKLRSYTIDRVEKIKDSINSYKSSKSKLWIMYEPYPVINRDLVEEIGHEYNLVERIRFPAGHLDNQVTDIYVFNL